MISITAVMKNVTHTKGYIIIADFLAAFSTIANTDLQW